MSVGSRVARSTRQRLGLVLTTIDPGGQLPVGRRELWRAATAAVRAAERPGIWLALALLHGQFPTADDVMGAERALRLDTSPLALRSVVRAGRRRGSRSPVEVFVGRVLVDVQHTARTGLGTGIQRVVRETILQWQSRESVELVGWHPDFRGLRRLSPGERQNALYGGVPHAARPHPVVLAVPWRSTYLLPELAIEARRTERISALAEHSGNATGAIGFDCVPLTSAETTSKGMGAAFGRTLSATARLQRVATISAAAAVEYEGWKRMLSSAGLGGPDIREILLPNAASPVATGGRSERAMSADRPLLLCVGSHEPRKNHLAVVHAAEVLWRAGHDFELVFVGGNSWESKAFEVLVARRAAAGRAVRAISHVSDDELADLYARARCSVFPSLNEGYGLPVAESLAVGTPVVTSAFGSMKEIGEGSGALLVDPRDDAAIARAIAAVMFDETTHRRLRAEAESQQLRTWADYAAELWDYLAQTA